MSSKSLPPPRVSPLVHSIQYNVSGKETYSAEYFTREGPLPDDSQIDLKGTTGSLAGKVLLGIYKVGNQGRSLLLAIGAPGSGQRPRTYDAVTFFYTARSGWFLLLFFCS